MMKISLSIIEEWKTYNNNITFILNIIEPEKNLFSIFFLK